ncbi:MAG: hypothetical protein P8020_06700 [Acidobacteriota bacterium]
MRAFRPLSFMIAAVLIQIPCVAAEQIRTIPVIAIRMVYAKTRHEVYLSVPEVSTNYPNSVTVVDSATLSVKKSLPLESVPTFLALSEDETYLYVTLSGGYVTRIDLDRFTRDLTFSTVDTGVESLRSITDIRVFPNNPHSVVVAVDQQGSDPVLAAYEDGVMRPKKTPTGLGVRSFTFGADPSTIWGHQSTSDRFALYHLQVDREGISVLDEGVLGLAIGWFENPRFWNGRLYTTHGRVSDPAAIRLATCSAKGGETGALSFALPPGGRIARLLTELVPSSAGQSDGYVLIESTQALVGQQLFGTNSLTLLSAVPPQVIE